MGGGGKKRELLVAKPSFIVQCGQGFNVKAGNT